MGLASVEQALLKQLLCVRPGPTLWNQGRWFTASEAQSPGVDLGSGPGSATVPL